ncbi:DNA recombination protein RmuC [Patescibacteria group bacterium]|nr:DNA recombination protein RmuC [Patescibacteria group bacterium]
MVLVYLLLAVIIILLVYFIVRQSQSRPTDLTAEIVNKLNEQFPQVLKNANEHLVLMAQQKLGAEKQEITSDLTNKKTAIEDLVKRVLEELNRNNQELKQVEQNRIGSFSTLAQKLEEQKALTQQLSTTAEGLKKVLSNNQMRGAFGERIAEDLLKMNGFVRGTDYEFNKEQAGTETRPDFAVFLPDGAKINVDAKFPYSNLQKMTEVENLDQKNEYAKAFERDVRDKIKQVTSRDYIDPENKTVDFVILFIPNEMIFSYIYEKMPAVWEEAMQKKVVFAGPFSFTAILRMVRQAYDNFRYQKNVQHIIAHIKVFEKEFENYNLEFDKIGDRIDSLAKQYTAVSTTRTKQLQKVIDRIRLNETDDHHQPPLLS